MKLKRVLFIVLATLLIANSMNVLSIVRGAGEAESRDTLTAYHFDPTRKEWVASTLSTPTPPNPDGSKPEGSHTVEIFLQEDEPVKAILIAQALVSRGTDPLVEIIGRSSASGARGDIRICNLLLKQVDAKRLDVKDTEAVRVDFSNTVAKDNELDVEINAVNVVRCGRGANSVISLGIDRKDVDVGNLDLLFENRENGLRVDRIRILGPEGKSGYIENLIVLRTSVFGEIEVRDVKAQSVVLDGVTLDDSISAP